MIALLKHLGFTLGPLIAIACSSHASGQAQHISSELSSESFAPVYYQDMDGDSLVDIILPHWSQNTGRELHIYLQSSNGTYAPQPSRRVEIKPEIIAFAFADTRPAPGKELILITDSNVFSLSSAIESYSGNLAPLFEWNFVASAPERKQVLHFAGVQDINNDGLEDLLLPGREAYGYFQNLGNDTFSLAHQFDTVNTELSPSDLPNGNGRASTQLSINEKDGLVFKVTLPNRSAFDDFLSQANSNDESDDMLATELWRPSALISQMNNDSRADFVYMNIGNDLYGQINVLVQSESGQFAEKATWKGPIDTSGEIQLLDFNGDGSSDIIRLVNNSNEWDVYFYTNRDGSFNFDKADQVMRFSGYDVEVKTTKIAQDASVFLSVQYYTIPVVSAIRNASIVRTQLMYELSDQSSPIFSTRPNFRLDESFSAEQVRGLSSAMQIDSDLDGDGRNDALYITETGALEAKSINDELEISDEAFWQYVPSRSIVRFATAQLNDDEVPDFILYHSNAISLLVSTP
ncbi:MAG: VCBS repeat-containing protein [Pseudohongiellaceae bacterium]|nr:VCBS repeat-containing protein [Pseudohongiellaceae bacterium]